MNRFLLENLLNIALVANRGRRACLIETAHVEYMEKYMDLLKIYADECGCIMVYDKLSIPEFPRYICSTNGEKDNIAEIANTSDLGSLLGMVYLRSDFDDYMTERVIGNIYAIIIPKNILKYRLLGLISSRTTTSDSIKYELYQDIRSLWKNSVRVCLYTEVSKERSLLYQNILKLWYTWKEIIAKNENLLRDIGDFEIELEYTLYTDDGIRKRAQCINDAQYFLNNFKEYANDVWNFSEAGTDVTLFDKKPNSDSLLSKYTELWQNIMAPYL